jgi:DNA polymerase-4
MDAFYAAVEVLDDPSLAGRPLIVGGIGARGVVASCSYEARRYGVRSAMSSTEAVRRCPHAVFRAGRFERYQEISTELHAIFASFTPLVEGIALDEAFLDVSGATRLLGSAETLAWGIRSRVTDELGLSCSVGVASTKVVAKLASEAAKPTASPSGITAGAGVVVVAPGDELAFLHPLPIEALWGVGPVTSERLRRLGVNTVGHLAATPIDVLESVLGRSHGRHLHQLALGIDPRRVVPDRAVKSIGHEETYARDRYDPDSLAVEVIRMADAVADRVRAQAVTGRTVTLKLRYADFSTVTRSKTVETATNEAQTIARVAIDLLRSLDVSAGVRLLGVSLSNLAVGAPEVSEQLSLLFAEPVKSADAWTAASDAVAEVRRRFGASAVGPAVLLDDDGLRLRRTGDAPWGPRGSGTAPTESRVAEPEEGRRVVSEGRRGGSRGRNGRAKQ